MDTKAVLEANKNLSEKVTKLTEELNEMRWLTEDYKKAQRTIEELNKRLEIKQSVARVYHTKDGVRYIDMIADIQHTEDGIVVEIITET